MSHCPCCCVQTFTGHSSEVLSLLPVPVLNPEALQVPSQNGDGEGAANATGTEGSIEGCYFLSAATGDRLVSAWYGEHSAHHGSQLGATLEIWLNMHLCGHPVCWKYVTVKVVGSSFIKVWQCSKKMPMLQLILVAIFSISNSSITKENLTLGRVLLIKHLF